MSIDYGEKERQFLDTLKADTGRALDEWMAAIDAEALTHRNDIIDWLRRQGFMFSKASWLERIHNNGGRPIYTGAGSVRPQARPRSAAPPRPRPAAATVDPTPPAPAPTPPPASPSPPPATPASAPDADPAAMDALLARAKAYRPLMTYVIAEIRKKMPAVVALPRDGYLVFRHLDADFALLAVSPKELRLGLAVKGAPPGVPFEPARLPALRGAPPMTHMAVLTDARQITPALLAAIVQAAPSL